MLVLSRKPSESLRLTVDLGNGQTETIFVHVVDITNGGSIVRLGITAAQTVRVLRDEISEPHLQAANPNPYKQPELETLRRNQHRSDEARLRRRGRI